MKKKSTSKRKLDAAKEKCGLAVIQAKDGEIYVTYKRQGCRFGVQIGSSQALTTAREVVSEAIELSVTPSEGKEILELAVAEVLAAPNSKKELILPRVGKGAKGPEILLNPQKGKVVRFKDGDYEVFRESDVIFVDNENAERLPIPVKNDDIKVGIKRFRKITGLPQETCRLVLMFILAAYRPYGPYPILVIQGESGTTKSILTALIRLTVDPSSVLTIACPASEKDLFEIAKKNHMLAFDNVSGVSNKMYDALCRLSSGGGIAVRRGSKLGMAEYSACRPIILNGIDNLGIRNDFLQRAIVIHLPRVEDHKNEQLMMKKFMAALPKILGSLFQAVAHGYKHLKEVNLKNKPRMAGFIEWSVATGKAFGWTEEVICGAYEQNQKEAFGVLADSDTLMLVIQELARRKKEWNGIATELLGLIKSITDEVGIRDLVVSKDIPARANVLTRLLNRSGEKLMAYGVEYSTNVVHGARLIHLRWIGTDETKKED